MSTSKNLNKDHLDRFYTKPSVVDDLLETRLTDINKLLNKRL